MGLDQATAAGRANINLTCSNMPSHSCYMVHHIFFHIQTQYSTLINAFTETWDTLSGLS